MESNIYTHREKNTARTTHTGVVPAVVLVQRGELRPRDEEDGADRPDDDEEHDHGADVRVRDVALLR